MSDSKKPTVSEIYSLMLSARPLGHKEGVNAIHYLLNLVERMGDELRNRLCWGCESRISHPETRIKNCPSCREARALIEESKL